MLRSIERGISLDQWDYMTVGMILDYIIAFNNSYIDEEAEEKEEEIREATQVDFDAF